LRLTEFVQIQLLRQLSPRSALPIDQLRAACQLQLLEQTSLAQA
jgi:hypothetical protein